MKKIPLVDLKAQYEAIGDEIREAVLGVLSEQRFILGPEVARFEEEFSRFMGGGESIGCSSGTDALVLIFNALGLGPGDEIVVPTFTFAATAEAVCLVGARPVFADVERQTLNVSRRTCEPALTVNTRAVVAVHLCGRPAPLQELSALCQERGLHLIEDAAQAHGAMSRVGPVGLGGVAAGFSFYPGKNLGAYGDAGAVTTTHPDLAHKVRMLRDHGRTSKYEHELIGRGARLDAIQAAVLRVKLRHLRRWTDARREAAVIYRELLRSVKGVTVPPHDPGHVYHLFTVEVDERDRIVERLQRDGIEVGIHYRVPLHLQAAFRNLGWGPGSFPESEALSGRILSLPLYPELGREGVRHVVRGLEQALAAA